MKDDKEEKVDETASFWVIGILLAVALAFMLAAILLTSTRKAHAGELQSSGMAYCSVYAREAVRIDVMHTMPVDRQWASKQYLEDFAVQVFKQCISILPTLLPLPEEHRSLASWEEDITSWVVAQQGVVPATGDNPEWAAQCAAEYRSFNPDDGTVVRRGSSARVKCPCLGEVDCTGEIK